MNTLKLCVGVLLVFILGALAGALGTKMYFKHRIEQFAKGGRPPLMHLLMRKISHELDLTETQQSKIEKIVDQTQVKLHDFRQKHHPELKRIIDNSFVLIKEKLNDEQKKKLDELHEELKSRRSRRGPRAIYQPGLTDKILGQTFSIMKERLNLTEEQEVEARPIIEDSIEKQRSMTKKHIEQGRWGFRSLRSEMQEHQEYIESRLGMILTENQMEEYRKIQEDQRQKMCSEMRQHRSRRFDQVLGLAQK